MQKFNYPSHFLCALAVVLLIANVGKAEVPQSIPVRNPFLPSSNAIAVSSNSATQQRLSLNMLPVVDNLANISQYKLSYVPAKDLKEAMKDIYGSAQLSVDPFSNSILFKGTRNEQSQLKEVLQLIDVPSKQITLEAKIISLSNEESKNLGINWNWGAVPQHSDNSDSESSSSSDTFINNGRFRFWRGYSFNFAATLNALFSKGKAKILASPHIVTIPGKEGSIFIGEHIPYQIEKHDSSGNYTATEYIDAGIKLKYTPILNAKENLITAAVETEVSTPTLVSELKNYKVTSRQAKTTVRMQSGETLVIGGLVTDEEQKSMQKIPFLGDIPILGNLFKNRTHTKNKTEILLLLTPYVTKAGESPAIFSNQAKKLQ